MTDHLERIRDQFTRQAIPFSTAPSMTNEASLAMLADLAHVGPDDTVLDVACGPGLVAAAFAKRARQVTGIDLVPAMIERATQHCAGLGLANTRFEMGDVTRLPYGDGAFTLVTSRYAMHHMEDPVAVLAEQVRVCARGQRLLLVDAICSDDPAKGEAWNCVEKIRDPSHVAFRPLDTVLGWLTSAGLAIRELRHFPHRTDLESLLARSFPDPGGADRVRALYAAAVAGDALGVGLHRVGNELRLAYPTVAILAAKPL